MEVGSTIEYEVVSRVNGKPFFSIIETFTGHEPVDHSRLSITVPENLPLQILNTGVDETIDSGEDSITYTWTVSDAPSVKFEESLPDWWTFNPSVFVSCGDWEIYSQQLLERLRQASREQPEAIRMARKITGGIGSHRERVIAIRNWVAENIRPAGPSLPDPAA